MTYAISDVHGYPFAKVMDLLQKVGFGKNDFLFVLGDVIDRGGDGIKMLQWMMAQPNVELVLGNHEAMLLSCDFVFEEIDDHFLTSLNSEKLSLLSTWQLNGATPTIKELTALSTSERTDLLEYLRDVPLYDSITVNGQDFLLTHSGLGHFDEHKKMRNYAPDDLLWNRPKLDTKYFNDLTVIFGHTPTLKFGEQYKGKILKTDTWIDIDTGTACGYPPALLCFDTMREIYL